MMRFAPLTTSYEGSAPSKGHESLALKLCSASKLQEATPRVSGTTLMIRLAALTTSYEA